MGGKERGAKSFVPFVKIENTAVTALLRTRRVYRSNVPRNNIGCDAGNWIPLEYRQLSFIRVWTLRSVIDPAFSFARIYARLSLSKRRWREIEGEKCWKKLRKRIKKIEIETMRLQTIIMQDRQGRIGRREARGNLERDGATAREQRTFATRWLIISRIIVLWRNHKQFRRTAPFGCGVSRLRVMIYRKS